MPTSVPSKEALESAVLDFAWRCGRKAYDWSKAHGLIPVIRLEKVLSAFTQGWRGKKLDATDFFLERADLVDLLESGSLEEVLDRSSKRARKYSSVSGISR